MNWISVDEKPLPKEGNFFVYLSGDGYAGSNMHSAIKTEIGYFVIGGAFAWDLPPVTHWMEAKPPTDKG